MLRRDFVRAAVAIGIFPRWLFSQKATTPPPPPPAPVPWTLGLNPKTPLPHTAALDGIAEGEVRFFTRPQMATLTRLADVLVPPVENKPGAVAAETPAFMDFLIGGSPVPRQAMYSGGLNWLDLEAQKKYKMPFAKLSDEQAGAVLKPWLRTWMSDHPPTEPHADFINIAHDEIRTATVNSKAWSDVPSGRAQASTARGLYFAPIAADLYSEGYVHGKVQPHVQAAAKAAHPTASYPR